MPRRNPLKYRVVIAILTTHDKRFEVDRSVGKGSHRRIYHGDVNGEARSYHLKCYGENDEIQLSHLTRIIRRFELPKDIFWHPR